jgi:circadian clock protein KaiB
MTPEPIRLRLYVAGDSPNSHDARVNLTALCREHFAGRIEVEIVDVFEQPQRALAEGVLLTPMLLVLSSTPPRQILGTLAERERLLQLLGEAGAQA